MNLQELIMTRRSVKDFKQDPVSLELIEQLLNTAVWAPNHKHTEPWRFILLNEGEIKNQYLELRKQIAYNKVPDASEEAKTANAERIFQTLSKVPLFMFTAMKENEDAVREQEDFAACCCVIQNFLLLAWERGIGTAWKTFTDVEEVRTLLKIEKDEKVVSVLHIGYPQTLPESHPRTPVKEKIIVF